MVISLTIIHRITLNFREWIREQSSVGDPADSKGSFAKAVFRTFGAKSLLIAMIALADECVFKYV